MKFEQFFFHQEGLAATPALSGSPWNKYETIFGWGTNPSNSGRHGFEMVTDVTVPLWLENRARR
jgi:hypothetical protein